MLNDFGKAKLEGSYSLSVAFRVISGRYRRPESYFSLVFSLRLYLFISRERGLNNSASVLQARLKTNNNKEVANNDPGLLHGLAFLFSLFSFLFFFFFFFFFI